MPRICYIYADMIKAKKINPSTGEAWKLLDVPQKHRNNVETILNEN